MIKRAVLRILVAMFAALCGISSVVAIELFGFQELLKSPFPLIIVITAIIVKVVRVNINYFSY